MRSSLAMHFNIERVRIWSWESTYSPWMALGKDQHYLQSIFGLTKSLPHQCSIYVRPIRRCSRSHRYISGWALCIDRNRKWIHHQHRKKMSFRDFVHWSGCKSHLKCYPNSVMDSNKYKMLKLSINFLGSPRWYPTKLTLTSHSIRPIG